MSTPAYTRLPVDDRRRQLLERATELFATHGYDELSMAKLARAAGISKPLVYHYFPSKKVLFEAALAQAAEAPLRRLDAERSGSPADQLGAGLDALLGWIEHNGAAYEKLVRSAGIPDVRELVERVREATAQRILAALAPDGPPAPTLRAAVHGWLWYLDGACLDWVRERDMRREELHELLVGTLRGALVAAGSDPAVLHSQKRGPP